MRSILHILTKPEDELTRAVIDAQRALADTSVEVVPLSADADYDRLLDQVFTADSVEVW